MFRYGLVGNILTYGGIAGCFYYVGFELDNFRKNAPQCPEEFAKEIFDPKAIKNFGSMSKPDIKNAAAKLHLQEFQRQSYVQKRIEEEQEGKLENVPKAQQIQVKPDTKSNKKKLPQDNYM